MSYNTTHVIQQPRPYRSLIIATLAVALTASGQWWFQNQKQQQLLNEIKTLKQELVKVTAENNRLLENSPRDRSDLAIEKSTNQQLRRDLNQLQEKLVAQNKDILFFQSITQGSTTSKLQFRELDLQVDNDNPDRIRYRLVITQGKKISKAITGDINIIVNLEQNGTLVQRALAVQKLNLRHVQVVEGFIELKETDQPKTLAIDLIQNNKITLSKTFDWKISQY